MTPADQGLVPEDFATLLAHAKDLPIIGEQAVSWWATHFDLPETTDSPLTSRNLDLWADRSEVEAFSQASRFSIEFPGDYDMTVLSGIAVCTIGTVKTQIEFLHTVPGLDLNVRESTTVTQNWNGMTITLLDPISLLITKLHALRNFSQTNRPDVLHLNSCLLSSNRFIAEALKESEKLALWYIERVLRLAIQVRHIRLAAQYHFDLRQAIPIQQIQSRVTQSSSQANAVPALKNFLNLRWPEVNNKLSVD